MSATAELRWFYPGEVPAQALAWFETLGPERDEASLRADVYLLPTHGGLNVKVRAGRVEVKRRCGRDGPVRFGPEVAGVPERWQKWTFEAQVPAESTPPPVWIRVEKQRRIRTYAVGERGLTPVARSAKPEPGCDLELVALEVRGERWWSLCLEASGRPETLSETLLRTAAHVFGLGAPPALGEEHAFGYADWLLRQAPP